jgi:hypothetical protein
MPQSMPHIFPSRMKLKYFEKMAEKFLPFCMPLNIPSLSLQKSRH